MQFVFCDKFCVRTGDSGEEHLCVIACLLEVAHYFRTLCHKESFPFSVLLQFQRTDEFDLVFTDHDIKFDAKIRIIIHIDCQFSIILYLCKTKCD